MISLKHRLPKVYSIIIRFIHLLADWLMISDSGKDNIFKVNTSYFQKSSLKINGHNNDITIHNSFLDSFRLRIIGNNNRVLISDNCNLHGLEIWIEDDGNIIEIGESTIINGNTHLACIEGKTIRVGSKCLFSSNITFRVGDSHSILENGRRINPSKDIILGNHVWLGNNVTILKGVTIGDDSVIGTNSVVTHKVPTKTIYAGNPAKEIKNNITWNIKRIPTED